ncbi:hypothetical protein ACWGSK_14515 [Nocardiopsis sp. NPDC055551]
MVAEFDHRPDPTSLGEELVDVGDGGVEDLVGPGFDLLRVGDRRNAI